jgi:hypothetical protein
MSRNALDVDAAAPSRSPPSLEASLRPEAAARAAVGSEVDLAPESTALRVDLRSMPPRPEAPGHRAPPRQARAPSIADHEAPPKSRVNLLAVGAGLIVAAIALGMTDRSLRKADGSSILTLGPVTPMLVAGVFFAVGVGLLIYQFLPHDER